MNTKINQNLSFRGYDVRPLKGLYMQGLCRRGELCIFEEMKNIAQKEGLDIFVNSHNQSLSNRIDTSKAGETLSIWAQDLKAFVQDKTGLKLFVKDVIQDDISSKDVKTMGSFEVETLDNYPRGGNYYLGKKENGENWILVNSSAITNPNSEESYGEVSVSEEKLMQLFDVKLENIFKIDTGRMDLDEVVRPIGYPYILVESDEEALDNLDKFEKSCPKAGELIRVSRKYLKNKIKYSNAAPNTSIICSKLREFGFKPILIAGNYMDDINYLNAIAFENKDGKTTYITNSVKNSYKELGFLERLFDRTLKQRVPSVSTTYYVSGGQRTNAERNSNSSRELYAKGLTFRNVIMDILANQLGGIHCMTAEIPDFNK